MYDELFDTINGGKGNIKQTSDYISAVIRDVVKEESITLEEHNVTIKDISKYIVTMSKQYMFERLNEL